MKKVFSLLVAVAMFAAFSTTAFAAGSVTDVVEVPDIKEVETVGAVIDKVTDLNKGSLAYAALEDLIKVSRGEEESSMVTLIQDNISKMELDTEDGQNVESIEVLATMNIKASINSATGKAEISFDAPMNLNLSKYDGYAYVVMHANEKNEWEVLPTRFENNKIIAEFTSFSPVAIVLVKTNDDESPIDYNGNPETGGIVATTATATTTESNATVYVVLGVVALAVVMIAKKKNQATTK